ITYPVELAMATIPNTVEIRSISRFGLSVVTVVFKDEVDIYTGRQLVFERISQAQSQIPPGLGTPEMAPISTGLGEIYQYVLINKKDSPKKYTPMELRTIQDWIVKRQLIGTPGVAEVSSFGGFLKQYEVSVDPDRLQAMNVTITDIFNALEENNSNTGGAYIEKGANASFIRGIGVINSLEDVENIVIKEVNGIPLLIRDVAEVGFGTAVRYGALTRNGEGETVGGIVLMLKGENSMEVVNRVKSRISSIQKSLPEGIELEAFLDRSTLINKTINTVTKNLVEGALIVIFILVLLLGNIRAGLIVASVIPLSMLFAISMMNVFNVSGNLMSLGAIDFGLIVDGAVIIVESIVHRITSGGHFGGVAKLNQQQMDKVVLDASVKIRKSAAFGEIIILIVYLPILALVGIEGKMFQPMAQTVSFAIFGALILSLTYVPMMSSVFLKKDTTHKRNISDIIIEKLQKVYQPVLNFALKRKLLIVVSSVGLFLVSLVIFLRMGGEFIPTLIEGDLAIESSISPGSSLSQSVRTFSLAEKILLEKFPSEVKEVVSKIGSAEIPTDPMPIEAADITVILYDPDEWKVTDSREELIEKMEEALSAIPGLNAEFSQPIQLRFNELLTGVKQDVAVKIYGEDLNILYQKANEVAEIIRPVEGVADIKVEQTVGLPQILVNYNRNKIAQYGLSVDKLNHNLNSAFAGSHAGIVYEGEKRFSLVVRLREKSRRSIRDVENLFIPLPNGNQIPLKEVATIQYMEGAMQVSRDNTRRRTTVGINVRDRDVESVVDDIKKRLSTRLSLPPGYSVTYGGQFENLQAGKERLQIAVPVALALIFVLLFFTFHSVKQTVLIFTAIPMAAIGGVFALLIRGMPFSISAGVGFIALFGVAVLNGIVLISYLNQLKAEGLNDLNERIKTATKVRLRPVIMTAAVASLGFLPMALSQSEGAEVQRPLATVVIGGLITSTILTLVVLPVLYSYFETGFKLFSKKGSISRVLILIVISIPFISKAQGHSEKLNPLTIQEAIALAYENNPSIKQSSLEVENQNVLRGTAFDFPKTSFGFSYGQFDGPAIDNSISIGQDFRFPTYYTSASTMSAKRVRASEYQLAAQKNELARNVKIAYLQLALVEERLALLRYQDSLYRDFARAAEVRYRTGETAYLEKVAAEARLMQIENSLMQARVDSNVFQQTIQRLIGINSPVTVSDDFFQGSYGEITDTIQLKNNPYLNYLQQLIAVNEAQLKLERASLLPDLSIGFVSQTLQGFHEINGSSAYYGSDHRFNSVRAGVAVPLWFKPYRSRIQSAKIEAQIAEARFEAQSLQMEITVQEQISQLIKQRNTIEYFQEKALPQANLLIDFSQKSYRAGEIGYIELLNNISEAIQIRLSYIESLNNFNQIKINLEYLIGGNY
ncbi:MAG: CusA/CzcA family heavy metal efflux RND transporter, partial [Cytophagaceae bacterium]